MDKVAHILSVYRQALEKVAVVTGPEVPGAGAGMAAEMMGHLGKRTKDPRYFAKQVENLGQQVGEAARASKVKSLQTAAGVGAGVLGAGALAYGVSKLLMHPRKPSRDQAAG